MNALSRTRLALVVALLPCVLLPATGSAQSSGDYFRAVDLDRDGRVSLAEFQERLSWAFQQMDRNRDQRLDPEEQLVPGAPTLSLREHHRRLAGQFARQDKNGDGWLSRAEFLAPPG